MTWQSANYYGLVYLARFDVVSQFLQLGKVKVLPVGEAGDDQASEALGVGVEG
jgi:hypothetical protein